MAVRLALNGEASKVARKRSGQTEADDEASDEGAVGSGDDDSVFDESYRQPKRAKQRSYLERRLVPAPASGRSLKAARKR